MRRKLRKITSVCLAVIMILSVLTVAPLTAFAAETDSAGVGDTYISGDFEYEVLDDGTASITDYYGSATELEIPSTLDGYTVTEIGMYAFFYCTTLTSVTMPNSIKSIGNDAFEDCTSLESITIPDSVTTIGFFAFEDCTSLESITIGNSVTTIGGYTFSNCTSLVRVTIPDSVIEIDKFAFVNTKWYNDQPDGVVYAGKVAYNYKGEMPENTSITLEEGTKGIAVYAFGECKNMTSITMPNSIKSIGDDAFEDCTSLESVTIGNGVTKIGNNTFKGCTSLTSITIPDSVTTIGNSVFYGCTSLENITIPKGVTSIGGSTFVDTAWYNNQPDGLIYINNIAYRYKGEMPENTNIVLEEETASISDSAFSFCQNLIGITIPVGVKNIGDGAFFFCNNLKNINIPEGIESIGVRAFQGCVNIKDLSFPQSLKNIDWCAFNSCNGLEEVILPKSIKTLGFGAFAECANLNKVIIPGTLEVIEEGVFYKCKNLEEVMISEGVKTIKEPPRAQGYIDPSLANGAFRGCSNLKTIIIPKSITSIGEVSFDECVTICGYIDSAAETYAKENGFDFVPINEYIDSDTKISVTAGINAELKVAEITDIYEIEQVNLKLENEKVESIYDISFVKDGTTVQPVGTATVKISCTNEISKVYRLETDGSLTDMNAVYDNDYMVFSTNHFSLYVLTLEKSDVLLGDVDGDGKVSIDDVTDIQKHLANMVDFTDEQEAIADVDNDGKVTIDDVTLIQKYLAGMISFDTKFV